MEHIVEYSEVNDGNRSRVTVLEKHVGARHEIKLLHRTAGYECAGSCARWTDEGFSVMVYGSLAPTGQRFRTEADARVKFANWTMA